MKKIIIAVLLLPMLLTPAAKSATSKYKLVDNTAIRNSPQTYYKKYIQLKTTFLATSPSMPYFIERTFSSKKYYMLIIAPNSFRVIGKRKKELDAIITTLKRMTPVILYGKVKKYNTKKHHRGISQYYLDLDKIEIDKAKQEEVTTKKEAKKVKKEIKKEIKKENKHDRLTRKMSKGSRKRWKKRPNVITD